VRQSRLTGVKTITRSRSTSNDDTGRITVYVAGPDGAVDGASVTAAQNAVEIWSTPLCIRPTVASAVNATIDVTGTITGSDIPGTFLADITDRLGLLFAGLEIASDGGDILATSVIIGVIEAYLTASKVPLSGRQVVISVPSAATTTITAGQVPKLGTVAITEV
jgi:hypothetical protein